MTEFLPMAGAEAFELANAINEDVGCGKARSVPTNADSVEARIFTVLTDYSVMCFNPALLTECVLVRDTGNGRCPHVKPPSKEFVTLWNKSIANATVQGEFVRSLWVPPKK